MNFFKKRIISIIAVILMIIALIFAAYPETPALQQSLRNILEKFITPQEISWTLNSDGTYTFVNHMGDKGSMYAWYVLDENGEPIYKTKYSESPEFIYDLKNDRSLTIKGFVRTGTEADYEQASYKLPMVDVLGIRQYAVSDVKLPDHINDLLYRELISMGADSLPSEKVRNGDGSDWEVDLSLPVDWTCPNISVRSYGTRINGFNFLDTIYLEYLESKNESDGRIILSYMLDWASQNSTYSNHSEWIWHDDATARRVLRWCIYYNELKDLCSEDEQAIIEASLSYQAGLLNSDDFYTEQHNHGMHQDIALLVYSFLYENNSELQKEYIVKALSRTGNYLDYVYADDGVHKEHSPYYARDVLADTMFIENLVRNTSPEFSEHVQQYIAGGQKYLIQLIEPDGSWPSLGDSSKTTAISAISTVLADNAEFQFLQSGGENGTCPASDYVFEDGGYAMFRSSWADSAEEATWMLFNAATHSSTHKHGDDLEVLLYHKGDLLVEAGKRNYNYSDQMTAWAYSGYGHNVLIVNDEPYPVKVGGNGFQSIYSDALKTGITDYAISENTSSVTGFECRFENVEQTRELTYNRVDNTVIVKDSLEATEAYKGTLLWHIATGVEVVETSDGWDFFRDGKSIASMSIFSDAEYDLETILGQDGNYPYMTWIFNGENTPSYGSLLKINFEGNRGETTITTQIELK